MDIRPENARWYGLFLMEDIPGTLYRQIENQHVTFGYKVPVPEDVPWGEEYEIELVGYADDGINEGYMVELPEEVMQWYQGAEVPHITLSVSEDGKPVDTWALPFVALEENAYVTACFGYYMNGEVYFG